MTEMEDLDWTFENVIQKAFAATNEISIDALCWGKDEREPAGKTIIGVVGRMREDLDSLRTGMKSGDMNIIVERSNSAVNNAGILRGIIATHELLKDNIYQKHMADQLDKFENAITDVTSKFISQKCR